MEGKQTMAVSHLFPGTAVDCSGADPTKRTDAQSRRTRKKQNWAEGTQMPRAVAEWDSLSATSRNKKRHDLYGDVTKETFAERKGIPYSTFKKYAGSKNRRAIGGRAGRKSVLTEENIKLLLTKVVEARRANRPLTFSEKIGQILSLQPGLTRMQAKNFVRTLDKRLRSMQDAASHGPVDECDRQDVAALGPVPSGSKPYALSNDHNVRQLFCGIFRCTRL